MRPRCTKRKGFWIISPAKNHRVPRQDKNVTIRNFMKQFQLLDFPTASPDPRTPAAICSNSQIRDPRVIKEFTAVQADSRTEKISAPAVESASLPVRELQD
jgi:hypothetical protein